jgi:hypothetical protein
METFHLHGSSIPENRRNQVAGLFGHLFYVFDKRTFVVRDTYGGVDRVRFSFNYVVVGSTDTSITLSLRHTTPPRDQESMTLFRVSQDALFVKGRSNLEYFKRVAA